MTDCILVKANHDSGYRKVRVGGRRVNAARLALEAHLGRPLKPGHVPDHLCRVRNCVNPDHLQEVTGSENSRRAGGDHGGGGRPRLADTTPCPQGHVGQFYRNRQGHRVCRPCERAKALRYWHARTASTED